MSGCTPCGDHDLVIDATVEADGTVLLNAAHVVAWLHHLAEHYGDGHQGGTQQMRRGARLALTETAEHMQSAYVDACADEVLDGWRPTP